MLKDTLYTTDELVQQEGSVETTLHINVENNVFKGHFPGQSVLPGACMLQILKEVTANALNCSIRLKKADQMKFLSLIDPQVNNELRLAVNYKLMDDIASVTATIHVLNDVCFRFKGSFEVLPAVESIR